MYRQGTFVSYKKNMLNGISKKLTGEVLKVLSDMGHGDVLVLADSNFPGESICKSTTYGKLIRLPGLTVSDLYEAINDLFPVDVDYSENPISVMDLTDSDKQKKMPTPAAWVDYENILHKNYPNSKLSLIERNNFYDLSKKAFVVIQTGENRQYGNLMIVKGCVL